MAIYRVTLRGTIRSQAQQITRYWDTTAQLSDFQQFADQLGAAFESAIDALTHTDVVWNDLYISAAQAGSLGFSITPANFPFAGTELPANGLPNHDAVLLIYQRATLAYPRQNRNRISGAMENAVTNGVLSGTALTDWETVAQALGTAYTVNGTVWSPYLWSAEYQAGGLVSTYSVSPVISTQRTRRIGAGA